MSVEHRVGDLFDQDDVAALGHGVNCVGAMNSGIAPLFRQRWPEMFQEYRRACSRREIRLGGVFPWTSPDGLVIYNMATQHLPGPNADLHAVRSAVAAALSHAEQTGITSLAVPRIGAGIGGLRWGDVLTVLDRVAGPSPVRLVVVTLPGQAQ